jgi:hypothetical protein
MANHTFPSHSRTAMESPDFATMGATIHTDEELSDFMFSRCLLSQHVPTKPTFIKRKGEKYSVQSLVAVCIASACSVSGVQGRMQSLQFGVRTSVPRDWSPSKPTIKERIQRMVPVIKYWGPRRGPTPTWAILQSLSSSVVLYNLDLSFSSTIHTVTLLACTSSLHLSLV